VGGSGRLKRGSAQAEPRRANAAAFVNSAVILSILQ
jgi:hypothetical protein